MKAFFDITLPTSWASLTERQLRYAYRQIARGLSLPAITALCLLKWGQLQVKFQHLKYTHKHPDSTPSPFGEGYL